MICTRCGHSMPDGSLICEHCGTYLGRYADSTTPEVSYQRMRQGRMRSDEAELKPKDTQDCILGDFDLASYPPPSDEREIRGRVSPIYSKKGSSRPDTRRGLPVLNPRSHVPNIRRKPIKPHTPGKRPINWAILGLVLIVLLGGAAIGARTYWKNSDEGQRSIARKNASTVSEGLLALATTNDVLLKDEKADLLKEWNKAKPQAYWLAGQADLDSGDVESAIRCFLIGSTIDPDNYDGLLLLANAYELNVQDAEAEELYLKLAGEVSPSRSEAYTALIRMYQSQERRPEAAEIMRLAYEGTGKDSFRLEREDYVPLVPMVSLNAGRYDISKLQTNVSLTSPQGYDIYYTTDDNAVLPDEGKLSVDGTLVPDEGSVTLRAVCVSDDLVSDEIKVSYTFYYPSPPAPKCNLAPNTYKKRHTVSLRAGEFTDDTRTKREKAEDEQHYRYYYTIDGSTPTVDSPVFDGTPIQLPSGHVTLRAICVNQYDKISSILEVGYKFDVKPYPLDTYQETDQFTGFVLNKTRIEDFKSRFGEPTEDLSTSYLGLQVQARHLNYPWGYAVFVLDGNLWTLVRIEMNSSLGNAPRGVGFGSSENDIVSVYKDFGQVQSPNGDRGLYYSYPSVGKVIQNDDGTRTVQYSCSTVAGEIWVLQYHLRNDRVYKITHYYQP